MPSLDASTVYAMTLDGLNAFERATGKLRWAAKPSESDYHKSVAVGDDRVIACLDGELVAFAKQTGKKLWTFSRPNHEATASAGGPIIAGNVVVCALDDSATKVAMLYAVDVKTGKQLWSQGGFSKGKSSGIDSNCTPGVSADGMVFVQADDGLKALR